jgi:hypothetical protein
MTPVASMMRARCPAVEFETPIELSTRELAAEEQLLARHTGQPDGFAHLRLVAIAHGGVDEAVSGPDGVHHRPDCFDTPQWIGTESHRRDAWPSRSARRLGWCEIPWVKNSIRG